MNIADDSIRSGFTSCLCFPAFLWSSAPPWFYPVCNHAAVPEFLLPSPAVCVSDIMSECVPVLLCSLSVCWQCFLHRSLLWFCRQYFLLCLGLFAAQFDPCSVFAAVPLFCINLPAPSVWCLPVLSSFWFKLALFYTVFGANCLPSILSLTHKYDPY